MQSEMQDWHRKTAEDTLKYLDTSKEGLSSEEAKDRLVEYGPNELEEVDRAGPLRMFLQQFADPMVMILIFAIIISIATVLLHGGHEDEGFIDAIVISAIVIANAVFGFIQEFKSEKALEALKDLSAPTAIVHRNGEWVEIEARDIVPGDIISLGSGDIVPADARLVNAVSLAVDESALTGESLAVQKNIKPIEAEKPPIGDMINLVFQGSVVTAGKGTAVVTATGMKTEFGKIAQMVQESEEELTPLQVDLESLGKRLGVLVLVLSVLVFIALVFAGSTNDWNEALFTSIAVAVAAIPEGLSAVVTVTLSIGVSRMVKKNAIVRRLSSVETLGSTTVICSDKTGTITKNEMTVRYISLPSANAKVSGTGYSKEGQYYYAPSRENWDDFSSTGEPFDVSNSNEMNMLLKAGQLCSSASLARNPDDESSWRVVGDPTEGALLVAAEKAGITADKLELQYEEITEFSFDSKRKRMTSIYRDDEGQVWAFTKGAPEVILERSTQVLVNDEKKTLDHTKRNDILEVNMAMAARAMRVIALAYRPLDNTVGDWNESEVENDLVFLGLVGMIDSPREGVMEAIAKSREAGVRPIMITGDHALTAVSIARSVGLTQSDQPAVTGSDLAETSDEELERLVLERDVFARVAPEHKLRIVRALKNQNHVVAMTGDGVNDAPAIKKADIGISMGIRGAGVTKESSDLILTDDDFSTIVSAIEVGREIYANIRKFVRFLLSANAGEVLLVFIMAMIGLPIPLTPIYILWINLVTDGPPALALGFDPPPEGIMERPPREPSSRLLDNSMVRMIIAGGVLVTFTASFVYLFVLWEALGYIPQITGAAIDWSLAENADILVRARTATFATMVLFQLLWVWNCRDERNPIWRTNMRESKGLFIAVVISFLLTLTVIYTPLSVAFGTVPLSLMHWVLIFAVSLIGFLTPVYRLLGNSDHDSD
ncbi:cation-transporting P-type ATPase [Candidatus Thorarchaeota archaeon]|nr:MAG: cation-transporting P-type ATPase [Candidatus Thorarchaeota archaeon]